MPRLNLNLKECCVSKWSEYNQTHSVQYIGQARTAKLCVGRRPLDLSVTKYIKFSIIALWTFYFKMFHSAKDGKIRLVSAVC